MAGSPRVQLSLKGRLLSEVAFVGPQLRVGRMRENDVVVNNLAVSRFHAVLRREGDGFVLEDLGSENGTQLNGERITGSVPLTAKDVIQLGKYELRLALQPGMQIAGAPKAKASDAWDASQTYLALDPTPTASPKPSAAPSAPTEKPAFPPSPLAVKPAQAPTPSSALAREETEEELELPVIEALELESEPEPAAAAAPAPDPEGVFAFGEDEVASTAADVAADSDPPVETAPLTAPNPEHTSLFDFGSPAEPEAPEQIRAEHSAPPGTEAPRPAAPAAPRAEAAKLYAGVIVQRDGKLHSLKAWEEGELCAGRAPECEIVLADAGVSRRHAVFSRNGDRYGVRDLGSVNGIYVNGQRTKQHEFAVGDVVRIESFELTFVLDHSPIGSEVSSPTPAAARPQELGRATQFSLEAPAREHKDGFELAPPLASDSTDPHGSQAPSLSFDETTDGFEVLPPADDPMAGEAQTAEPVLALELPESDVLSADGIDDDDEKEATIQGMTGAQALREAALATRGALRMRLVLDTSQLSSRAREALAVLADEGVEVSARLSFARD